MKNYKIYLLLLIFFGFTACEKELDVDVDSYDPQVVIEAKLSNRLGDAVVSITQSLPLNDAIDYPRITGAEVTITELETANVYRLNEVEEGIYHNENLTGTIGNTYKLQVSLSNGQTYTSMQQMPEPVNFYDVTYDLLDISFGEDEDEYFEVQPEFLDIAGIENYYQLIITKDGEVIDEINVFKDLGFDGLPNTQRIVIEAHSGDEINFDLHNITSSAYEYLLGVAYNLSQGSATPTNPTSNLSGGALGYFKVYSANNPITIVLEND